MSPLDSDQDKVFLVVGTQLNMTCMLGWLPSLCGVVAYLCGTRKEGIAVVKLPAAQLLQAGDALTPRKAIRGAACNVKGAVGQQ